MTMPTLPGKPLAGATATTPARTGRGGPGSPGPPRPREGAAGKAKGGWSILARQLSGPSGPIGHLVTGQLARGNAAFNRWLVHELSAVVSAPATVIELGCGPGIALKELLRVYPAARVVGVDPSTVVHKSARRRNARAVADGRLTLATGDIGTAAAYAPADLVVACHVLYFWPDPVRELQRAREILAPAGYIALGYQLRQDMPAMAQRTFPKEGFTLYDSDDEVAAVAQQAGFTETEVRIFGDAGRPGGRLALARPTHGQASRRDRRDADEAGTCG